MDPVTHTMAGAALGSAGLRRVTPLAMPMLILAANAPDVDILVYFAGGEYAALAFRRGWTHGVLALVLWPFVLLVLLLAWDRWLRRIRDPAAEPARPLPLLALAAVGVLTHPALDWLNNYGIRWLMPFDGTWFYGDALFIIDPWVWLALGGTLCLAHSRGATALAGWLLLGATATALVVGSDMVPDAAKAIWVAGVLAVVLARLAGAGQESADSRAAVPLAEDRARSRAADGAADRGTVERPARARPAPIRPPTAERYVRGALALVGLYAATMVAADRLARAEVRSTMEGAGYGPVEGVMIAPLPADPLGGSVVVATSGAYYSGSFRWVRRPRFSIGQDSIPRGAPPALLEGVRQVDDVSRYLIWARFPFYHVVERTDAYSVLIGDARYADMAGVGSLRGLVVELDREFRPVPR